MEPTLLFVPYIAITSSLGFRRRQYPRSDHPEIIIIFPSHSDKSFVPLLDFLPWNGKGKKRSLVLSPQISGRLRRVSFVRWLYYRAFFFSLDRVCFHSDLGWDGIGLHWSSGVVSPWFDTTYETYQYCIDEVWTLIDHYDVSILCLLSFFPVALTHLHPPRATTVHLWPSWQHKLPSRSPFFCAIWKHQKGAVLLHKRPAFCPFNIVL